MCALLEKIKALTQAAPFKAYVPVVEFSREEQAMLSDARADIVNRDGTLCYCVWNMHLHVRSFLATKEELDRINEDILNRAEAQRESFALEG